MPYIDGGHGWTYRFTVPAGPRLGESGYPNFPRDLQVLLNERQTELDEKGGFSIAGRVSFSDKRPIRSGRDVMVNLHCGGDKPLRIYEGGWFLMDRKRLRPLASCRLIARAFGYAPIDSSIDAQEGQITFTRFDMQRLPEDQLASITGVVLDADGEPFAGARVKVSFPHANYGMSNRPFLEMRTGADGAFAFDGLPSTELKVLAASPGHAWDTHHFTPKSGEQLEVELALQATLRIVIKYVYQPDGSRRFDTDSVRRGTIEWTAGRKGVDFSDGKVERYERESLRDLELRQKQKELFFRNVYLNGRNGFYDAGNISFDDLHAAEEAGYQALAQPCKAGHVYVVKTYEGHFAKFIVQRIEPDE
jgi:hypothetical protein